MGQEEHRGLNDLLFAEVETDLSLHYIKTTLQRTCARVFRNSPTADKLSQLISQARIVYGGRPPSNDYDHHITDEEYITAMRNNDIHMAHIPNNLPVSMSHLFPKPGIIFDGQYLVSLVRQSQQEQLDAVNTMLPIFLQGLANAFIVVKHTYNPTVLEYIKTQTGVYVQNAWWEGFRLMAEVQADNVTEVEILRMIPEALRFTTLISILEAMYYAGNSHDVSKQVFHREIQHQAYQLSDSAFPDEKSASSIMRYIVSQDNPDISAKRTLEMLGTLYQTYEDFLTTNNHAQRVFSSAINNLYNQGYSF